MKRDYRNYDFYTNYFYTKSLLSFFSFFVLTPISGFSFSDFGVYDFGLCSFGVSNSMSAFIKSSLDLFL